MDIHSKQFKEINWGISVLIQHSEKKNKEALHTLI